MKTEIRQVTLEKVKLLSDGGVHISETISIGSGGAIYKKTRKDDSSIEPHPDLIQPIRGLKKYVLDVIPLKEESHDKVTVTGITITGVDANKGVIITSTFETPSGRKIALNTDRITFGMDSYGWEAELEPIIELIEDEAYLYAHENKQAQLEIAFPEEEEA